MAVAITATGAAGGELGAQRPLPFSSLDVRAGATSTFDTGELGELWRPSPGLSIELAMPFYVGYAAAALTRTPFRVRQPGLPSFVSRAATMEWGLARRVPIGQGDRVRVAAAVRAGSYQMRFADSAIHASLRNETELLVGARVLARVRLARGAAVVLGLERAKVYTHVPLRLSAATAAVSYELRTPAWLRTVLE